MLRLDGLVNAVPLQAGDTVKERRTIAVSARKFRRT